MTRTIHALKYKKPQEPQALPKTTEAEEADEEVNGYSLIATEGLGIFRLHSVQAIFRRCVRELIKMKTDQTGRMVPTSSKSRSHRRNGSSLQSTSWFDALFASFQLASKSPSERYSSPRGVDNSFQISAYDLFNPLESARLQHSSNNKGTLEKALAVREDLLEYGGFLYGEGLESESEEETELWDSEDEDDISWAPQRDTRVSFQQSVTVKEIPSRDDYGADVKDRIWNSTSSINRNAARNRFEFLADGGNWRTAAEEDTFAYLPSGELVHPATWTRAVSLFHPQEHHQVLLAHRNRYVSKYMNGQEKASHLFAQIKHEQALRDHAVQSTMVLPAVLLPKSSRNRLVGAPQPTY